jgi:hypothetical protein
VLRSRTVYDLWKILSLTVDESSVGPQAVLTTDDGLCASEDNPAEGKTLPNRKKPGMSTIPRTYYSCCSFSLIGKE